MKNPFKGLFGAKPDARRDPDSGWSKIDPDPTPESIAQSKIKFEQAAMDAEAAAERIATERKVRAQQKAAATRAAKKAATDKLVAAAAPKKSPSPAKSTTSTTPKAKA